MKYDKNNPPFQYYMKNSTCYCATDLMRINGIIIHSIGKRKLKNYIQPMPIDEEVIKLLGKNRTFSDLNHSSRNFGVNAWIGEDYNNNITSIQTLPWDYRSWGCGAGENGTCNNGFIQISICKNKTKIKDIEEELQELLLYLCDTFNINPNGYIKLSNGMIIPTIMNHNEAYSLKLATKKDLWIDNINLQKIKNNISYINNSKIIKEFKDSKKIITLQNINSYLNPDENSKIVKSYNTNEKLRIVEIQDTFGKLKNKKGWINLKYVDFQE